MNDKRAGKYARSHGEGILLNVASREYKAIVDVVCLTDIAMGLRDLQADVTRVGRRLGLTIEGDLDPDDPRSRFIRFLDTPDFSLRANDLLLRQRVKAKSGKTEYTLKCRTEDRYVTAGAVIDPAAAYLAATTSKFEEDIGAPFISRFSHSATIEVSSGELTGDRFPGTLGAAGQLFPSLLAVKHDERVCPPQTSLLPVREMAVFERVFGKPTINLGRTRIGPLAVIVWSRGKKGRLLTAEISFRHENMHKTPVGEIAPIAKKFFERLQQQDWMRPGALSKTQYMYVNL